ncbi:MAG: gamma-glutamylcyclotransferase [Candidatus Binatia bacterium]|nr:gamma-glutamylcyclotransferase [Candidatus Binatia bacterium]
MSAFPSLFVYGTLRDANLVYQLTGKSFRSEEAWLLDYERHELPHTYPFVTASPGKCVRGLILYDVDQESLTAFDRYECRGVLYDRVTARAKTRNGVQEVLVYVRCKDRLPLREQDGSDGP